MPTDEQALQFVIMLQAGLPPSQAILYFIESDDASEIALSLRKWNRSAAVRRAQSTIQTKKWQDMDLEERMRYGLEQHYSALAYLLYSTHYAEVGQADKAKLDSARGAIEARIAGTAGKMDALTQFAADLRSGKLRLGPSNSAVNLPPSPIKLES